MKPLSEQVNEIKAAKASRSTKRASYKKLGLTDADITYLLTGDDNLTDSTRTASFTFGVEIECGVNRNALHAAALATGMHYQYESYNHRDGNAYFKFVTDGSLSHRLADGSPIECVSPVLKGSQGRERLKNAVATLNRADAEVDRSCGLHVHIGAADLTEYQYCNVFVNYAWLERLIDSFMAPTRRGNMNEYARTLGRLIIEPTDRYTTRQDIVNRLSGRYFKVNPIAYTAHRTIEFRQHQGTVNAEKIINWVMFCGKLVNWSKKHRLTADTAPQTIDGLQFLNAKEKAFFKARQNELANR